MIKQKYDSPLRREQAAQTRQRIADIARRLFAEQGYPATTVSAVAATARVSEPTVYRIFGDKRGILLELLQELGRDADSIPTPGGDVADPESELQREVQHMVRLFGDWSDFTAVVLDVGRSDPMIKSVGTQGDRLRRLRQAPMVRRWHTAGVLRAGLSGRRAADVLWAMTGPEQLALMTQIAGWSLPAYRDWLGRILSRELFGQQPRGCTQQ